MDLQQNRMHALVFTFYLYSINYLLTCLFSRSNDIQGLDMPIKELLERFESTHFCQF